MIPGTLQLTATLPLFDRNQGNRAKAQSVATQNCYNLQAGLVDLRAEIEEAVRDFNTAYQNARSVAQEQLKLAAEVRDSITKAYDAGGRPLIDVLDAERSTATPIGSTFPAGPTIGGRFTSTILRLANRLLNDRQILPHDEHPH